VLVDGFVLLALPDHLRGDGFGGNDGLGMTGEQHGILVVQAGRIHEGTWLDCKRQYLSLRSAGILTPYRILEPRMKRLALAAIATVPLLATAAPATEPGVLLREGEWRQGVGSYMVPNPLQNIQPGLWPAQGWHQLNIAKNTIEMTPVAAPARGQPEFLKAILKQIAEGPGELETRDDGEAVNAFYLRVPGARLSTGAVPAYVFANGTPALRPILDKRYELVFAGKPFAFTVQNGERNSKGVSFGEGALYTIEYDGNRYEYLMAGFGWEASIKAIADLDGDGKPDFILYSNGNNSGFDAVILSSLAKPGRNPVTALLMSVGC
jgi:hypothetical protein